MTSASASTSTTGEGETPRRGKRSLILALVVLLVATTCGWWFLLRPAQPEEAPIPGEVIALEPVQLNLSGGRYLRIGVALEVVEGADEIDGSKALDAVIEMFSGRSADELGDEDRRAALKGRLVEELQERYQGDVITVYFTDLVTQ